MRDGFPPTLKRLGQHFLADERALERIVDTLAPTHDDTVVEIGPGRGAPPQRRREHPLSGEVGVARAPALGDGGVGPQADAAGEGEGGVEDARGDPAAGQPRLQQGEPDRRPEKLAEGHLEQDHGDLRDSAVGILPAHACRLAAQRE